MWQEGGPMSVEDFIKKSILESDMFNQAITAETIISMIISLVFSLLMGAIIYRIYRTFFKGVIYSSSFALTLVGMCVLTCMVTIAISSNIVISLGMVGALSIVRYRTAVKEPLDLLYLFWSITTGITAGASMYLLAILGAIVVTLMMFMLNIKQKQGNIYVMIVHFTGDHTADMIEKNLNKIKHHLKSKTLRDDTIEIAVEVACKSNNMVFLEKIRNLEQVQDVTLIQYNGEYNG